MPKVRDVLTHVTVETAKRKRICHRDRVDGHSIPSGIRCLVIKDAATGGSKNYCLDHGNEILDAAEKRLGGLRTELVKP